jgi:uncharacterized membrane protein
MKNVKLSKLWDSLHSSYWFIPTLMAASSIILAWAMLTVDRTGGTPNWWWIYTGGTDGARSLLSSVAGSMVSVVATAFSITIVALQLASSNFGPRLLRNFMQDTGNQIVLGTFIGTFIIKGSDLALVLPGERVNRELTQLINDAFIVGKERTEYQDAEFPINQLVEIALRALSPGINDPFTAIRYIDRLSAGLSRIAQRDFPSPYRYDAEDNLRVIVEVASFEGLVNSAFNQIRHYGYTDVAVTIRLLEAIARISPYTRSNKDRALLLRHAAMIERGSLEKITEECDRASIIQRYEAAAKVLKPE